MGIGIFRPKGLRRPLALSQKISLIFAAFFCISTLQTLIDHGSFLDIFNLAGLVVAGLLLLLAFFDNIVIRVTQVSVLLLLGFLLIWTNADASDLSAFVLFSIALAAAYKMSLFGRKSRIVIGIIVLLIIVIAFTAGMLHDFTFMQRLNIVNFIIAYMALLYFIFEEETLSLRGQRDALTRQANDLRPFATLGSNTAGLVHDFKGDVAGLFAIASIERLTDNPETAARIQVYADRLNDRVEAILDVATAVNHYEREPLDLVSILKHVVYYFVEVSRDLKHQVKIVLDVEPELTVMTRRNALMVVLENVIKNAIEATEGRAERTVNVTGRKEDDGSVVVVISHDGRGLPPEFGGSRPINVRNSDYFHRGKSLKTGGTGLGMINVIRALEVMPATMLMQNMTDGVECRVILDEH